MSHYPPIFVLSTLTFWKHCLTTSFKFFKNSSNWLFLSTKNVNVARYARNYEWDFQTSCHLNKRFFISKCSYLCLSSREQEMILAKRSRHYHQGEISWLEIAWVSNQSLSMQLMSFPSTSFKPPPSKKEV